MNFFSKRRRSQSDPRSSGRRSHRFVPGRSFAPLESRQLLAAGPLGVNLDGSMEYVDAMKQNAGWTPLGSSALSYDANGWPLADASVLVLDQRVNQPWNGPDPNAVQPDIGGTYHLSFTGKATVSPDWLQNYTVQNQAYNAQTNTTTADLVVAHNSLAILYIDFRNTANPSSASGAGVSNVRLIQPGYAANTTQTFTTNMLNALSPFGAIRYLNIDAANNYVPTYDSAGKLIPLNWSQRKLPSASSQTTGPGAAGQAWEYMVALANATNTDMWINVPGPATDDYVVQLAGLIKNGDTVNGVAYAGLKPGLKVYLEYSNEVWGGIGSTTAYNNAAAKQEVAAGGSVLNADGSTDPYVWSGRFYLERSKQIADDFQSVFGADPAHSTIRPILAWGEGDTYFYNTNLPWFGKTFGAPSTYFYGMGNANYGPPSTRASVDALIASLYSTIATEAATTAQFSTIATYYGMKNVAYEGGPQTSTDDPSQGQVALAAARDPRMEDLEVKFYQAWYAAGGDLTMAFDGPFAIYSPKYQWAMAEASQASNPGASAKYRGMVDLSQAAATPLAAGTTVSATGVTALPTQADSFGNSFTSAWAGQSNTWLINVPTAGTYTLGLRTNDNWYDGQVAVSTTDTNTVGTVVVGRAGGTYNLASLALHAGLNTISIKTTQAGLSVAGLSLTPKSGTTVAATAVSDGGFEAVPLAGGGYAYGPTGSAWAFTGDAGLTANSSAFTNGNAAAPQGSQVAFLQSVGRISQAFTGATAGTYAISLKAAQRANWGNKQSFQVLVDGVAVSTFANLSTAYTALTTASFTLSAGPHTVTFQGLYSSGDATAFLDDVKLVAQ